MFAVTRQFVDENDNTVLVHLLIEESVTTLTINDDSGLVSKNTWTNEVAAVVLDLMSISDEHAAG